MMKKKDLENKDVEKKPYVAPQCTVIEMETGHMCQTSVTLNSSASTEEDWNTETEEEGTIWLQ